MDLSICLLSLVVLLLCSIGSYASFFFFNQPLFFTFANFVPLDDVDKFNEIRSHQFLNQLIQVEFSAS
jgi:hypothetical protein